MVYIVIVGTILSIALIIAYLDLKWALNEHDKKTREGRTKRGES